MARGKVKKFSALVGTITVTTLLVLFFLAVPAFLGTTAGKVFSFVWLMMALVTLVAFGEKVFSRKRKRVLAPVYKFRGPVYAISKMPKGLRQKDIS